MALRRLPVDVDGMFMVDGDFLPRAMRLYKAHEWLPVVKVRSVQRAANRRVGGAGLRYDCDVLMGVLDGESIQRPAVIWREGDKFFVEEEVEEATG